MINPENKLFRWGPIDGKPIYACYWLDGFLNFTKQFPPGWARFIVYLEKEKFWAIADHQELYDKGEQVFKKYILNDRQFAKNYETWLALVKKFIEAKDQILKAIDKFSKEELVEAVIGWGKLYSGEFWNIGSLPEVANWGGEQMLARELKKKISSDEDYHYTMEKLTAPEDFSFYQKEELDLLSLKKIKDGARLDIKLKEHQQKYFWILNSYHHTKILPVQYFKKALASFSTAEAEKKTKEIKLLKKEAAQNKLKIIKKYGLGKEILKISRRLSFCIWWQDIRKSYIFQANYVIDSLLGKVGNEFKVDPDDLHYYTVYELKELISKNRRIGNSEIKARENSFFLYLDSERNHGNLFSGIKAKSLIAPFLEQKIKAGIREFKGMVVNKG